MEQLYWVQTINGEKRIMFPVEEQLRHDFSVIQEIVRGLRKWRQDHKIPHKKPLNVTIKVLKVYLERFEQLSNVIHTMANVEKLNFESTEDNEITILISGF